MKIDIEIDNIRKFTEVAFLVDRDDFLLDVEQVRREIKLLSMPYTFPNYPYKEANRLAGFYKNGQISACGTRDLLEEFCSKKGLLNLYALDKTLGAASIFAKSLTRKYDRDRLYTPVILASILIAHIKEEDFRSTQMFAINRKVIQEELKGLRDDEEIMTISVNRESTIDEVEDRFNFIRKYYFKTMKTEDGDGLNNIYEDKNRKKLADTMLNIKRDREWYWLKKNGRSYQDIRKHYLEMSKKRITLRGIELAIKRYSNNLI